MNFIEESTKIPITMKKLHLYLPLLLLLITVSAKSQITCGSQPLLGLGADTICFTGPFVLNASGSYSVYEWQNGSTDSLFNVTGPGVYYVTVGDTVGSSVLNGSFELGNQNFNSQYDDSTASIPDFGMYPEGTYSISSDPSIQHNSWSGCGDHTTGAGNMMVVNGNSVANSQVWCQTIAVTANTNYLFSAWMTSIHPLAPAELQFSIGGNQFGSIFNHSGTLCQWEEFFEVWNSGANTSIEVCITNQNTTLNGNDFALDDISFTPICTQSDTVEVVALPTPNFSAPNACLAAGTSIVFTNNSTPNSGTIISNDWNFGDGNTSNLPSPTHGYANTGNYPVKLIIENSYLCVDSISKTVNIYEPPVADFLADTVCASTVTSFTNLTTSATATNTWDWNFGNNTSSLQNPTNGYPQGGSYMVSLEVTDANGCIDDTSMLVVVDYLPQPAFSSNQVCVDDSTQFIDNSTVINSTMTSWSWSYGDATSGNLQNPAHLYANSGSYNVTLTVTSNEGCIGTISQPAIVHTKPTANFTFTVPCEGNTTNFTDQSISNINTWLWNFDDGQTSIQQNPNNLYATNGSYDVQLIVQNNNGCVDTVTNTITVSPIPDLSIDSIQTGCSPLAVGLYGSSTSTIANWSWDLGNGTTSGSQNPSLTYINDGSYDISLTVTDNNGCSNSLFEPNYITVYPNPIADFSATPDDANEYDPTIYFTDLSQYAAVWNWTLGDGATSNNTNPIHIYPGAGTYPVTLFVETIHGCTGQITKEVVIKPVFSFYVPNAFTPNDPDAINDTFKGRGVNIEDFNMKIFNRWGEKIFETSYLEEGWNGVYHGEQVQNDVYVYKIKLKDTLGDQHSYVGKVSVVN